MSAMTPPGPDFEAPRPLTNGPRRAAETAILDTESSSGAGAVGPQPKREPGRKRRWFNALLPIVLVLVGIVVLLYPVFATQFNNIKQREFAQTYNKDVQAAPVDNLKDNLQAARAYNATLDGTPILDPWLTRVSKEPESGPYTAYKNQLSMFDAMARVRVPEVGIELPVYHGTTDDVLAKGAGHLYGTSLPVGGEGTHAVLTSHTAFSNATLFDHLKDVKEGDVIYIDVYGETLAYQVDQIKVVLPNEIGDLTATPGQDQLTLFTCTPYAVNTHRLLVCGHRIPYVPAADKTKDAVAPKFVMEPWMYRMLIGAGVSVLLLATMIALNVRRRRRLRLVVTPARLTSIPARAPADEAGPGAPRRSAPD